MGSNNCWWHEQQESTLTSTNSRRHAESWPCMYSVRQEIDCRGTATPDSWCVHSHIQMHKKLPLHAGCDTLPLRKPGAQRDRMGRGHGRALSAEGGAEYPRSPSPCCRSMAVAMHVGDGRDISAHNIRTPRCQARRHPRRRRTHPLLRRPEIEQSRPSM